MNATALQLPVATDRTVRVYFTYRPDPNLELILIDTIKVRAKVLIQQPGEHRLEHGGLSADHREVRIATGGGAPRAWALA